MKKKQPRSFDNVIDMVRDLADDDFVKELEERIQSHAIITRLVARRIAKGISQGDVAQQLGCSQSRISKIEAGTDAELRLDELVAYGRALEMEFEILGHRLGSSSIDRVKAHAACIHREMKALAERVKGDQSLAAGASGFFGEACFNFVRLLEDAGEDHPKRPPISLQLAPPSEELLAEPPSEETSKPRQRARRKDAVESVMTH